MGNLGERLKETIRAIEETTVCFYQNNGHEGYRRLEDTLKQLDVVLGEVELFKKKGGELLLDGTMVVEHLTEAMKALEQKDVLLLADILQYEIKSLLEEVYEQCLSTIGE